MDSWKLSVALLEAFCALGFVVCGLVLGFCFIGFIGPQLLSPGGLLEGSAMLRGAILGTVLGAGVAVAALLRLSRPRRQRFATSALALAALTALFTGMALQRFSGF
jgi:hypothetical protein